MRLTIVNLLISGAIGETKRPASILARKHRKMNPPYAGRRTAADASYKVGGVKEARRRLSFVRVARPPPRPSPATGRGGNGKSHRHFAVPHRRARGQGFRCVEDGVGVHAVVAIEVVDGAGLAEMLDPERLDPVAAYAAEPAQRGGMAVDHGDDAAVARQRRQQMVDMAGILRTAAGAA